MAGNNNSDRRITVLEEKYTVIKNNSTIDNRLTTKVSLLLTIMSFAVVIVTAGAVYTFTGLNDFKDSYALDRMELHTQMTASNEKNAEKIQSAINSLEDSIYDRLDDFDHRLDKFEKGMIKIETQLAITHHIPLEK